MRKTEEFLVQDSITSYKKIFWLLFFGHFLFTMHLSLFHLFPLRIEDLGGLKRDIGIIMGLGLASGVLIRPFFGPLLDRFGRKRFFLIGGLISTGSAFSYFFCDSLNPLIYAVRVSQGLGMGILFATFFTYAADIVPDEHRVEKLSLFGISGLLPMALGPLLGETILRYYSFHVLFITATIFALASLFISLLIPETWHRSDDDFYENRINWAFFRPIFPVLVACFLFGSGVMSCFHYLAPFMRSIALSGMSPFFITYVIVSTIFRYLFASLPERIGIMKVYYPSIISFALGLVLVAFTTSEVMLMVAGIFGGIGHAYIFPILIALTAERARKSQRGTAISYATAVIDMGGMITTPLLGVLGDFTGYRIIFLSAAFIVFLSLFVFQTFKKPVLQIA